jgi:hypothetical protein
VREPSGFDRSSTPRYQANMNKGLQLSSTRSGRTGCIKQAPPATLMLSTPYNPHLPSSSGSVLTQHRLLPAYGQIRGCASWIERILDVTLMFNATSLACYWPFDRPLASSNQYQRGRATSRMPGSATPLATLLW